MAKEKKNKKVRRLTMTGQYTYYATIPKEFIQALGWRKKQKLTVRLVGRKIIIEDWKK